MISAQRLAPGIRRIHPERRLPIGVPGRGLKTLGRHDDGRNRPCPGRPRGATVNNPGMGSINLGLRCWKPRLKIPLPWPLAPAPPRHAPCSQVCVAAFLAFCVAWPILFAASADCIVSGPYTSPVVIKGVCGQRRAIPRHGRVHGRARRGEKDRRRTKQVIPSVRRLEMDNLTSSASARRHRRHHRANRAHAWGALRSP